MRSSLSLLARRIGSSPGSKTVFKRLACQANLRSCARPAKPTCSIASGSGQHDPGGANAVHHGADDQRSLVGGCGRIGRVPQHQRQVAAALAWRNSWRVEKVKEKLWTPPLWQFRNLHPR